MFRHKRYLSSFSSLIVSKPITSTSSVLLAGAIAAGCNSSGTPPAPDYFNLPLNSVITADPAVINVTGLPNETLICYTLDGTEPNWANGNCSPRLDGQQRTITLRCGVNNIRLMWANGTRQIGTSVTVESPACLIPLAQHWANDEQAQASQALANSVYQSIQATHPTLSEGNSYSVNCNTGGATLTISNCGQNCRQEAIQYNACAEQVDILTHDYSADPRFYDKSKTQTSKINLTQSGITTRILDANNNGTQTGNLTLTGEFSGTIVEALNITAGAISDGTVSSDCTQDPLPQERCAHNGPIVYQLPAYDCQDNKCPLSGDQDKDSDTIADRFDNCPDDANEDQADADKDGIGNVCDSTANGHDNDGDGIAAVLDNCPDVANADQADFDQDGIGDVCDIPQFYLLKQKASGNCLRIKADGDADAIACNLSDKRQQFEVNKIGDYYRFKNLQDKLCLNAYVSWALPYVNALTCDANSAAQRWFMTPTTGEAQYPSELKNGEHNFCIYNDDARGSLGNCGIIDADKRRWGIYPDGNFAATPIQP